MKTTLKKIKSHNPCKNGYHKLITALGTSNENTEISFGFILNNNGIRDAYWALRCWEYRDYCLLLANVVESALYIFETKYPKDDRPRKAIEAIRKWYKGEITDYDLVKAANDAYSAANNTCKAACNVAYAAAYATYTTCANHTCVAAHVAHAYATAYATYAHNAHVYATYTNIYTTAYFAKWRDNEKLMRKFLKQAKS